MKNVRAFRLAAVLFDFDGTLTRPEALDFDAIKRELGCPPDEYVLEFIEALPPGERHELAAAALQRFELEGAAQSVPNDGAEEAVLSVRRHGLKVGVITRNGRAAVEASLERFEHLTPDDFDVIVTRDDPVRFKPAPDGLLYAAERMGVTPDRMLMVGDFVLDLVAGRHAGCVTVYLTNGGGGDAPRPAGDDATSGAAGAGAEVRTAGPAAAGPGAEAACPEEGACDAVIGSLRELDRVVRLGLPLPEGKLPNELLAGHFAQTDEPAPAVERDVTVDRPVSGVLRGPGVGEDSAALELAGEELLVVHGDPITLASSQLGRYAVLVNANDIATSGAEPRWLLTTVLLPPGTTGSEALVLLRDIAAAAAGQGIAIAGGHTEITPAVRQPVVSTTMLGTLARAELRDKRTVCEGDRILLTKAVAVEGTALLADELGGELAARGMSEPELAACRALLDHVSIVPEARVSFGFAGARAMHDVTEGGLATAALELSIASGHRLAIDIDAVPVLPETRRLCDLLDADPLGLIASGSLLIVCDRQEAAALLDALHYAGIEAADIGSAGPAGEGIDAFAGGEPTVWPAFATDEAARLLGQG